MTVAQWLLVHGEAAQYAAYFGLLLPLAALERAAPARRPSAPRAARWKTNFLLTAANVVVLGALPISFITAAQWAESRSLGLLHAVQPPLAALVALNLLGRAFISWITHLLMHKVPLLWRVHRVHHTDTELDLSTTVRFHPLEFPIGLVIGVPLVLVMGLSPWLLLLYEILDVAVTLVSHASIALPRWLELCLRYVVVTPAQHRIHHSACVDETDSNYGAVFPIWDMVFGTFRSTTGVPSQHMSLGLEEVRDARARSIWWLLTVPLRNDLRLHPSASSRITGTSPEMPFSATVARSSRSPASAMDARTPRAS